MRKIGLLGLLALALLLPACAGTQTKSLPKQVPLPAIKEPADFLVVSASGANFEIESATTGTVVKNLGPVAGYTDNGLVLSPDGQEVYLTVNQRRFLMIERLSVATGVETAVAEGEQPSISPDGQLLAYATGEGGSGGALVVRDLTSGSVRSINLGTLLGTQTDLLNASITWLGDSTQVVVSPGEVGSDLMTNTTGAALPGSCSAVGESDTCLIMVDVGARGALRASRIVLDHVRSPDLMTGDSFSQGLRFARYGSRHTVIYEADVADSGGSFVRLFSLPSVLPLAFDTRGTKLLYLVGHNPIALWIGDVTPHGLKDTRVLNPHAALDGLAW